MKGVKFVGSSLDDLRAFPKSPREDMGRQINRVQQGFDPLDWKSVKTVGPGVREIRIRDEGNNYRCMYVANTGKAVYVLHVFMKKSQRTLRKDVETARSRFKEVQAALKHQRS